jgi:hypothetical protein
MARKEDVAQIHTILNQHTSMLGPLGTQVASMEHELKSIRRELNDLAEKVENVSGFRNEIDHALTRIAAIAWASNI